MPTYKKIKRASESIYNETWDTIVIGSGASGLTTAALLSKLYGQNVLILERHDRPGGCLHQFKERSCTFNTGCHYVGNLGPEVTSVCRFVAPTLALTLKTKPNEIVERFVDKTTQKQMILYSGKYNYSKLMGIDAKTVESMADRMLFFVLFKLLPSALAYFLWCIFWMIYPDTDKTFDTWMSEQTNSKEALESKPWRIQEGDHGNKRVQTPAILGAAVSRHYVDGIIHFDQNKFVRNVCKTIKNFGGKMFVSAEVEQILIEKGVVKGVSVNGKNIYAKNVVSAVGASNTVYLIKDETLLLTLKQTVKKLGHSVRHFSMFVGIRGTLKKHNMPKGNTWVKCDEFESPVFISATETDGLLSVHIIAQQEADVPKTKHKYEQYKKQMMSVLTDLLFSIYPTTETSVVYNSSGTYLTTKRYIGSLSGESYGLNSGKKRFNDWKVVRALRPTTEIQGLYLTGQDILMPGVCSAIASALMTVRQIQGYTIWNAITRNDILQHIIRATLCEVA